MTYEHLNLYEDPSPLRLKMTWLSDPGHAWLKVPLIEVFRAEVDHLISEYSYYDNNFAYLEEDCDAFIFLDRVRINSKNIREIHSERSLGFACRWPHGNRKELGRLYVYCRNFR
jgi:hypothetical protein